MSLLSDALIREGLITQEQLNDAKVKQIGAKLPLQDILIEMGFVTEEQLLKINSKIYNISITNLDNENIDPKAVKTLPYAMAKRHGVFVVRKDNDTLILAMSDPKDIAALDDIKLVTNLKVAPLLCSKKSITFSIEKYYQSDESVYDILKNVIDDNTIEVLKRDGGKLANQVTEEMEKEHMPMVKLCDMIITDAIKSRASDIHIEAQESKINIRFRIDGELKNIMEIPSSLHSPLIARIKILAELDITETRKPQDGRSKIIVNGKRVDLRVSIIPTYHGEKAELRVLDPDEAKIEFEKIGFTKQEIDIFKEALLKTQGIILVTGPTGSGKTSTLYAALNFIKGEAKNIVTIEDPIEYLVDGINQMQVDPIKDVTFATGLKSILRQDPNIILIGEIRDKETAKIAFQSSLTGHLVLSTLHTNNAAASITRLIDIGIEPYLIASTLNLALAQRLIKNICLECKEEYTPPADLRENLKKYIDEFKINKFYKGKGCRYCNFTGYRGRTAVFEVMTINDEIRSLINEGGTDDKFFLAALRNGMKPLVKSAMEKVSHGITTLEEVIRVVGVKEEDKIIQKSKETGEKLKVLAIDDEEDILIILEKRLTSAGYEVLKARDGNEGVEMACKEKPDLIITDATMPKMNGFEAIKLLRSRLETAVIPIIMLTARQDKESEIKGIDVGADDYIVKPFDADKLLSRVKMLLRRKQ